MVGFVFTRREVNLRQASTELRGGARTHIDCNFLVILTKVREHLLKRISTAVANVEVRVLDNTWNLTLLTTSFRLSCACRCVATHLCFDQRYFLLINQGTLLTLAFALKIQTPTNVFL